MKTASISTTKNQLSALIVQVRHGETILITDHDRPVAQLSSIISRVLRTGTAEPGSVLALLHPPSDYPPHRCQMQAKVLGNFPVAVGPGLVRFGDGVIAIGMLYG